MAKIWVSLGIMGDPSKDNSPRHSIHGFNLPRVGGVPMDVESTRHSLPLSSLAGETGTSSLADRRYSSPPPAYPGMIITPPPAPMTLSWDIPCNTYLEKFGMPTYLDWRRVIPPFNLLRTSHLYGCTSIAIEYFYPTDCFETTLHRQPSVAMASEPSDVAL